MRALLKEHTSLFRSQATEVRNGSPSASVVKVTLDATRRARISCFGNRTLEAVKIGLVKYLSQRRVQYLAGNPWSTRLEPGSERTRYDYGHAFL